MTTPPATKFVFSEVLLGVTSEVSSRQGGSSVGTAPFVGLVKERQDWIRPTFLGQTDVTSFALDFNSGAFCTLVPIRPRSRGERRSLRTFLPGASLRPGSLAFNPSPRRLSTPTDAFQLRPDVASYGPSTLRPAHALASRAHPGRRAGGSWKWSTCGRWGRRCFTTRCESRSCGSTEESIDRNRTSPSTSCSTAGRPGCSSTATCSTPRTSRWGCFECHMKLRDRDGARVTIGSSLRTCVGRLPVSSDADRRPVGGAFCTLVPIRPRSRGERRSLRTFAVVSLRPTPSLSIPALDALSTPTDAYQLHPDVFLHRGRACRATRTSSSPGSRSCSTKGR